MAHQYELNLPTSDKAISHILLQHLITEGLIVEELLSYQRDDEQNPVALQYTHTCVTFVMDPILQYLTSDNVDEMPENAALFYDLFLRGGGVPKAFWNTTKRKALQYVVEGASHDLETQFAYLSSTDRAQANSLVRCLMNAELGGRLTRENIVDDPTDGLCIMFPAHVKGGRLRDYICYLIGRKNSIKPVFVMYFFNMFVGGVNCYPLIPTRVLKMFVAEENLPERKALLKAFPLSPVMEQVVARLKGAVLYTKSRKLAFELSQFFGTAFTVERETHRIIYRNHEDNRCLGSTMENMLRFLVGTHSVKRLTLFDVLTFYRESDIDEILFGKGTLSYLRNLAGEAATRNHILIATDQGQKPVLCPQCACIFGPKAATVQLTEIYTLPSTNTSPPSEADFELQPPPKLLRSVRYDDNVQNMGNMPVTDVQPTLTSKDMGQIFRQMPE